MSAQHTPGPWECPDLDDECSSRQYWVTGPDGELIASLEPANNITENAYLIAAAPELLNALKLAVSYLAPRVLGTFGEGETSLLPKLKAAIHKATGEQA